MQRIIPISFPGGVKVAAQVDGQLVVTDQPVDSGGEASAAAPMDLFMASMATCAGYFALRFCQIRNIDVSGLELNMVCTKSDEKKLYTDFTLQVRLPADFPAKYKDSLLRAMDQCTVKRHFVEPPTVRSEVVD